MPGSGPQLLFIAHPFPPVNAISAVRTWNVAKHLSRLGWNVRVITPESRLLNRKEPEGFEETLRDAGIQRILTGHKLKILTEDNSRKGARRIAAAVCRRIARRLDIDSRIGWSREVEKACRHLTRGDADVVLATGSPFISFPIAEKLADRLECPFVLDYRDSWTNNPHMARQSSKRTLAMEDRLLDRCAAAITVSPSLAADLQDGRDSDVPVHVITNGYDPDEMDSVEPRDFGHFAIVYAGIFYPPMGVIPPVMAALRHLSDNPSPCSAGNDWRFHYYGPHTEHVRASAEQFGLQERVVLHGYVPREEVLPAVRGADLGVVITSVHEKATLADKGIVTGKIFEAMGLGTPVLTVAPLGSDVIRIVEDSGCGECFTGSDAEGMARYIGALMDGRRPQVEPNSEYGWPSIARRLDSILRDCCGMKAREACGDGK